MKRARDLPRLAISVGCPCGIGPEVSVVAALEEKRARVVLVSAFDAVCRAARARGISLDRLKHVTSPEEGWTVPRGIVAVWNPSSHDTSGAPGKPTARDGAMQLAWVDAACDLAARGEADAMVTGPVSKDVIASSGARGSARFLGHTEHLQRRLKASEVVMAFYNEKFTTALVTTHLPIAKVPRAITSDAVERATVWLGRFLVDLKRTRVLPKIAVCGLNPHAGEAGRLGDEEARAIAPGIVRARKRLGRAVSIEGPVPSETAFRKAAHARAYDGIVAMYHDQATIPMKLVGFGESVNISLGLPILRTSVDHGTGYDIAGKGVADARGMREAIALAALLSVARASRTQRRREETQPPRMPRL